MPSVPTPMAGHWTFDASAPWADSSGYKPAGTHDLLPVGTVNFSADVPPGRTGQSLDLTAGSSAVVVSNSNQQLGGAGGGDPWTANPTWENTFDLGLSVQMSITFWAKGFPDAGNPWIAKKGTDSVTRWRGPIRITSSPSRRPARRALTLRRHHVQRQ